VIQAELELTAWAILETRRVFLMWMFNVNKSKNRSAALASSRIGQDSRPPPARGGWLSSQRVRCEVALYLYLVGSFFPCATKTIENLLHPVFISDDVIGVVWNKLGEHYRESRKTKSYLAAKEKRAKKI
jgi:hypothetical protein